MTLLCECSSSRNQTFRASQCHANHGYKTPCTFLSYVSHKLDHALTKLCCSGFEYMLSILCMQNRICQSWTLCWSGSKGWFPYCCHNVVVPYNQYKCTSLNPLIQGDWEMGYFDLSCELPLPLLQKLTQLWHATYLKPFKYKSNII